MGRGVGFRAACFGLDDVLGTVSGGETTLVGSRLDAGVLVDILVVSITQLVEIQPKKCRKTQKSSKNSKNLVPEGRFSLFLILRTPPFTKASLDYPWQILLLVFFTSLVQLKQGITRY